MGPEPAGGPGTARDLSRGFKERKPWAGPFLAVPAVFGPENFHGAGDRDVPDPLDMSFLPPGRYDTAGRAARWLVGFDNDPAAPVVQDGGGNDAVVGQVEDAGGSVGGHPGRLSQGSWSCSWLNARHTHPSRATGPSVIYDTRSIPHEPRRAVLSAFEDEVFVLCKRGFDPDGGRTNRASASLPSRRTQVESG
ncbi:hypothetical protein J2W15_003628 [Pseudarthrobacter sulfonivorans]|nr:hypothetical protein [Pseudarthrobacter sulfonivorans]